MQWSVSTEMFSWPSRIILNSSRHSDKQRGRQRNRHDLTERHTQTSRRADKQADMMSI